MVQQRSIRFLFLAETMDPRANGALYCRMRAGESHWPISLAAQGTHSSVWLERGPAVGPFESLCEPTVDQAGQHAGRPGMAALRPSRRLLGHLGLVLTGHRPLPP